jgi:PucR-like helix-turn-helix protein/diguanylate cyclase with GGDEF domain
MASAHADQQVRRWGERFRRDPVAAGVVLALRDRGDEIWRHAFEHLQRESPEYRNSVDAEFAEESKAHCNELLRMIVAIAARRAPKSEADPFQFVRVHAQWRARHRVPLTASLHAYRLAHRTYWELTRAALPGQAKKAQAIRSLTTLSDFWIELFDHVGAVLAEAHAVEEGLIVAQSTRTHAALIDHLLRGQEPHDAEARQLCALCGIRSGASIAIAVAEPLERGNGKTVDREAALRSFVRLTEQALPRATFGNLIEVRNHEVVAIVCSDAGTSRALTQILRRSGFTRRDGNGPSVRVGIGLDVAEFSRLPFALEEARLAAEFAGAAQPLMHFADVDLCEFLIRRADDAAIRLVPQWARQFSLAEDVQLRELSRTIHAFADCNFNVKQTARRLSIHTNTVYFRLNRITSLTGINPRTYSGTSHLLTALRLLEVHNGGGGRL